MLSARFTSVLASGVLLLGSSAIAMAQGGPPEEVAEEVQNLELQDETATNAVENEIEDEEDLPGTQDHEDGHEDATAFSEWVEALELTGCQRGQTIAKYARQGPREFDPTAVVPVPESELPGDCATGGEDLQDAEDTDRLGTEDAGDGNGPPAHAGPPDHAGAPDRAGQGPPAHAGQGRD